MEKEYYKHICKCGCGSKIEIRKHHKWKGNKIPDFIRGHHNKGENNIMYGKKGKDNPNYGKKRPEITGEKNYWYGKKRPEHSFFMKNKPKSKEHRIKLSESKMGDKNPMKRPETIESRKRNNPYWFKNPEKSKMKISETRKRLFKEGKLHSFFKGKKRPEITGEKNPMYGQRKTKKFLEWRANKIFPFKDSSIEIKIQEYLSLLHIEFIAHKYMSEINHKYQCDILIPSMNLVIECDGDFIHCNPLKYSSDFVRFPNSKKIITAQEIWERDKIRTKELKEAGFKVLRLWENEIKVMKIEDFQDKLNKF